MPCRIGRYRDHRLLLTSTKLWWSRSFRRCFLAHPFIYAGKIISAVSEIFTFLLSVSTLNIWFPYQAWWVSSMYAPYDVVSSQQLVCELPHVLCSVVTPWWTLQSRHARVALVILIAVILFWIWLQIMSSFRMVRILKDWPLISEVIIFFFRCTLMTKYEYANKSCSKNVAFWREQIGSNFIKKE